MKSMQKEFKYKDIDVKYMVIKNSMLGQTGKEKLC